MPARVDAADPQTTGKPGAVKNPSDASAPFNGADAKEDVEMSVENAAEIKKVMKRLGRWRLASFRCRRQVA